MENVLEKRAHVTKTGAVNSVHKNCAMPDVMNMANAKMAPACVWPVGTENIAASKDVQQVVQIMDNAVLASKVYGNVDATMDGMVPTVRLHWNKTVPITKTMTKVCVCSARTLRAK